MPLPKDPKKLKEYKEKMSKIAKEKGYGKWMKGKKHSRKTKKKMSKAQKAIATPEECHKRSERAKSGGYGKWMKGKKASPKFIAYCKSRKGKTYDEIYGSARAEEEVEKRRVGNCGTAKTYLSKETKERIKTGRLRKDKTYDEIYGPEQAKAERQKRSDSHLLRYKDKVRNGCRDKVNGDHKYRKWRGIVFKRDGYTCQNCGIAGGQLHAHHIKAWADFPDHRYTLTNGETLCIECHAKKHPDLKIIK